MRLAGRLRIHARRRAGQVKITFDDNGPGAFDKIRKRIFEPFLATKETCDGTGIGLAFCHRIIGAHGSEITAREPPDRGARFVITLAIAAKAKKRFPRNNRGDGSNPASRTGHRR
ncbi:MAG: sensor histidine kinase [Pseudomonadota bacterium]